MSYHGMSSTRSQSQLCTATPISPFAQCLISFRLLPSSVAAFILISNFLEVIINGHKWSTTYRMLKSHRSRWAQYTFTFNHEKGLNSLKLGICLKWFFDLSFLLFFFFWTANILQIFEKPSLMNYSQLMKIIWIILSMK